MTILHAVVWDLSHCPGNLDDMVPQPRCEALDYEQWCSDSWHVKCYGQTEVAAESSLRMACALIVKEFACGQISVMVKRITLFRIVCFFLCAMCAAFCQSDRPSTSSKSSSQSSLPDAPSALVLSQVHPVQEITYEAHAPLNVAAVGMPVATARFQAALAFDADQHPAQSNSSALFFRRLYPSLNNPNLRYRPSDNNTVLGRATDAASRVLLTRDQSGKRRFNSTYFLRLATAVAADSASRKYRARSKTAPLSDFGSNVGNDTGMNLLHEFGPGLQQAVVSHLPKFVSRIQARILH